MRVRGFKPEACGFGARRSGLRGGWSCGWGVGLHAVRTQGLGAEGVGRVQAPSLGGLKSTPLFGGRREKKGG